MYRHTSTISTRTVTYDSRAFAVSGPTCWNLLPSSLKSPSLKPAHFCKQLKTVLMAQPVVTMLKDSRGDKNCSLTLTLTLISSPTKRRGSHRCHLSVCLSLRMSVRAPPPKKKTIPRFAHCSISAFLRNFRFNNSHIKEPSKLFFLSKKLISNIRQ